MIRQWKNPEGRSSTYELEPEPELGPELAESDLSGGDRGASCPDRS